MAASNPLDSHVAVMGAGPAGTTAALLLARKGFTVDVYEKRPDWRIHQEVEVEQDKQFGVSRDATKRSINLALSHRGQSALEAVGVLPAAMAATVPMPCRAIHSLDGHITAQAYGKPGQAIYSVSRQKLNHLLLDACDRDERIKVHWEASMVKLDDAGELVIDLPGGVRRAYHPRLVIGADGAYSAVRTAMLRFSRTDFARKFISHGYKELSIPATVSGDFALPVPHALHIWPREAFMLIALPNTDHTFTCTLFMPYEAFEKLDGDVSLVRPFFERHFPDALPLLPALEDQFRSNPTSSLVETRVKPWNYLDRIMLVGDAAHATVPFYGQGMNAALEDCLFFSECLEAVGNDLSAAVLKYAAERQPAGEALCDLSMGNYVEMRAHTAHSSFLLRKKVESWLHALLPRTWIPQYTMVAFTRIPYHEVKQRAARQDAILDAAMSGLVVAALGVGAVLAAKLARQWKLV